MYDEFTLTLKNSCALNTLKLDDSLTHKSSANSGAVIEDQNYEIDSTTVVLVPLYSASLSLDVCPLTATLYVWDEAKNYWKDESTGLSEAWLSAFITTKATTNLAGKLTIT